MLLLKWYSTSGEHFSTCTDQQKFSSSRPKFVALRVWYSVFFQVLDSAHFVNDVSVCFFINNSTHPDPACSLHFFFFFTIMIQDTEWGGKNDLNVLFLVCRCIESISVSLQSEKGLCHQHGPCVPAHNLWSPLAICQLKKWKYPKIKYTVALKFKQQDAT